MTIKNVLVIDSQFLICKAVKNLLEESFYGAKVWNSNNAQQAMKIVKQKQIELIILEVELKDSNGIDLVRRLNSHGFQGKILFLSAQPYELFSQTIRATGAHGFVSKTETVEVIRDAILAVSRGYSVFKDSNTVEQAVALSKRESVVFNYLSKGYSNQKIAHIMSLSSKTVSTYKSRILDKYNASSIIEVIKVRNYDQDKLVS